jgi:hypothetical protein
MAHQLDDLPGREARIGLLPQFLHLAAQSRDFRAHIHLALVLDFAQFFDLFFQIFNGLFKFHIYPA